MSSSPAYLATVVAAAVAVLLFLIIRWKQQPFVSLILVSMATALAAGMPISTVMACIEKGMGGTLGFIAVVVGLGAMFGQLLEVSGGAERLTLTLLRVFGRKRASWALSLAGFLVAIPIFFDVGFIILVPLVYALTRETKRPLLFYGIPLLAGLAVTHAFVPPTPGPIAVAQLVGADLGRVIFYGLLFGLPCAILAGPLFGAWIAERVPSAIPAYMEGESARREWDEQALPGFGLVFGILLLPLLLILLNTVTHAALPGEAYQTVRQVCAFIGHPFFALTAATLIAFTALGTCRGLSREKVNEVATSALAPAGLIILVTGAGGVFKQVLVDSGVGARIAALSASWHMPPLVFAWLATAVLRVMIGSATVAVITAAGIVGPLIASTGASPELMVLAVGAGSVFGSHVNDSAFWMFKEFFGLSMSQTFRSWTVMESLISVIGLGGVLLLDLVLG